jgi:hypothetical protein
MSSSIELTKLVTSSVRRSIGSTYRMEASGKFKDFESFGMIDKKKPDWSLIPSRTASLERIQPFTEAADLRRCDLKTIKSKKNCDVKIAPNPMGKEQSEQHFMELWMEEVIFKKFLRPGVDAEKEEMRYLQTVEESEIASFLAEQFNKSGEAPGEMEVAFLVSALVRVQVEAGRQELYFVESPLLEDVPFQKYVDNAAHWDEDALDVVATLPIFAKWTYDFTGG